MHDAAQAPRFSGQGGRQLRACLRKLRALGLDLGVQRLRLRQGTAEQVVEQARGCRLGEM